MLEKYISAIEDLIMISFGTKRILFLVSIWKLVHFLEILIIKKLLRGSHIDEIEIAYEHKQCELAGAGFWCTPAHSII